MINRFASVLFTLIISLYSTEIFAASGRTVGQFAVSPTGAARYSVPIWTPTGVRGIHPKLAIKYDSHLSYGFMGPGWMLDGLSSISRCNRTYAQDGAPAPIALTMADAFCLDGNRLRLTSSENLATYGEAGTTYQTEIANFSNVTANGTAGNGPSYFTVQGKDGLTYEYGNTTDSKILPSGSTTPYIWALDKVTDRSGNHMTFTYYQVGGAYVPLSIQYTAPNGSTTFPYQVNFNYTTKSANDTISKFISGSQIQETEQLSTITVNSSGTNVREYKLLYTTSATTLRATLTSIQECGGSTGSDCLAATTVGYQDAIASTAGVASPTTASGSGATNGTVYSVDIDGDGRQDLVFAVTSGSNYQWWVQLATATGFGSPINTGAVTVGTTDFLLDDFDADGSTEILAPVGGAGVFHSYKWNGTCSSGGTTNCFTSTPTTTSVIAGAQYSTVDVDGDGRPDIVYLVKTLVGGSYYANLSIQPNTSAAGSISFAAVSSVTSISVSGICCFLVGNNQQEFSSVKHFDFDGDGRQDLMLDFAMNFDTYVVYPLLSRGTGGFVVGVANSSSTSNVYMAVNWNDDACTDLIVGANVLLSPCNGSAPTSITLPAVPGVALDWDGDGRTDALANVGGNWELYRSEGTTFAPGVPTGISVGTGTWVVTDKDGDGLHDLAFANSAASNAIYYGVHNGAAHPPDLAISINDGYGNSIAPSYTSIAESNYQKQTDATFPSLNYVGPLYVVYSTKFSDPSNMPSGSYTKQYYYYGAWLNLQGRGFQGFNSYSVVDSRTALFEHPYYERAFPYTGMMYEDVWSNGTLYPSISQGTPATKTMDATANNERYFPYLSAVRTNQVEVGGSDNGDPIATTLVTYAYDNYGNATTVTTAVTDQDPNSPYLNDTWTSTTVTGVSPDTSTWCLNMPTSTAVTNSSTAPSGTAITRTVFYTPDYTNCRQNQKVTEPNSSTYKVTDAYTYEAFGNLHTDTTTGIGMAARVTTLNWGTTGQFLTTVSNPLSQVITFGYDPNSGRLISLTDPNSTSSNPIVTAWGYDDFARKTSELRPDGTSTTWAYNGCATSCVNANNEMTVTKTVLNVGGTTQSVSNIYLDSVDRPLVSSRTMLNGAYDRNEMQYNSLGLLSQQGAPCTFVSCTNYWTTFTYDVLNRLTQSQRPTSATNSTLQTTQYFYVGRRTWMTDPLNNSTVKINLVTGSLASTQDAKGYYQNFTYDAFGSLLSVTDGASPANGLFTATYQYGLDAFQTASTDMDSGARAYTVDALGEVTAYSDAKNQHFSMTYDALSRPTSRTESDLTTTWNWGNTASLYDIGKLQSVTAVSSVGTYSESYGYDNRTRLVAHNLTLPGDTEYAFAYTYNAITGLLDTLQYPLSTSSYQLKLQYAYTYGKLKSISDFNAPTTVFWTANSTNPRGQVTQETLGNGVITNRSYDAVTSWINSIQAGVGGGTGILNSSYTFDLMGDVTQRQNNNLGLTENFYYDSDYRLDHSTLNGTLNLQMTYDTAGMGNIASRSDLAAGAAWTYDPVRKHAVTQAGSSANTYTYDANGNAITRNGYNVTWTSYNYPSGISSAGESATFQYGPNRQRWQTIYTGSIGTETTYHVGKEFEKVVNGSTTDFRHYIFAGNVPVAIYSRMNSGTNTLRYSLEDHQGSFASILTSTGTLDVNESFTAYGNRRSGETWSGAPTSGDETAINGVSRHGYTGQTALGISMGLNHMNGRVQDAITGRFLSPDPYVPDPSNTQSFNRYSYVNNNPLSLVDPTGFDDDDDPGLLDEITVTASRLFDDFTSLFDIGSWFGSSGPKLTHIQIEAMAHGIGLSNPLQGAPSVVQSTDGRFYYALGPSDAIVGPQITGWSDIDYSFSSGLFLQPSDIAVTSEPTVTIAESLAQTRIDLAEIAVGQAESANFTYPQPTPASTVVVNYGKELAPVALTILSFIPVTSLETRVGIAASDTLVIGKLSRLKVAIRPGERTLLTDLNLGSSRANWMRNAGELRREMALGKPIRDVSVDSLGRRIDNTGFLRAERNLLEVRGWTYDERTTLWSPPVVP